MIETITVGGDNRLAIATAIIRGEEKPPYADNGKKGMGDYEVREANSRPGGVFQIGKRHLVIEGIANVAADIGDVMARVEAGIASLRLPEMSLKLNAILGVSVLVLSGLVSLFQDEAKTSQAVTLGEGSSSLIEGIPPSSYVKGNGTMALNDEDLRFIGASLQSAEALEAGDEALLGNGDFNELQRRVDAYVKAVVNMDPTTYARLALGSTVAHAENVSVNY